MSVPAIVNSASDPAAVTVTQTLGHLGIPMHALCNVEHASAFYSRYTRASYRTPMGPGGDDVRPNDLEPDALLEFLIERVPRGVIFPGSDGNVRFMTRCKQRLLEAGFHLCVPDEEVLLKALNKSDLALFCTEHGFPIPRTCLVDSRGDLERVGDELQFPIIFKGVYKKNHKLVRTREELGRVYETFIEAFAGQTDLVQGVAQEWIPGGPEAFAKLYVMCDQQGTVVATHQLRRLRIHSRADGSQGDTLIAKTERIPRMVEQWIPFYEALGWVGMASMECKYDHRDDCYKLIEINPRPWAILKVSVDCGMNVPLLYYRLAQGLPVESTTDFQAERYYIRLLWGRQGIPEPAASLGMLLRGQIGLGEVLGVYARLLANAGRLSIDVGKLQDPVPTLAAMHYYGLRDFRRWFGKKTG